VIQYVYRRGDQFLIVNGVPCEQCEYCGEQYFSGEILIRIEDEFNQIHQQGKKAEKLVMVPMEQFADLRSGGQAGSVGRG
jgi:YgiT-type zinc finger domain-containing protein